MLPKEARVSREEFSSLPSNPSSQRGDLLLIRSYPQKGLQKPKVAVICSKKVVKKAHERNKVRRRVYALFREAYAMLPGETVYVAQITSKEIIRTPFSLLQKDFLNLLKK